MTSGLTYESTSRSITGPMGTLHYHEAGPADGPPLVLIHGSGPGVSGWANFSGNLATFASTYRTFAIDLPGFGASDPIAGGPQALDDAVVRFMDTLGIEHASLLGNSMGGGIASRVAAQHPARVDRLICIGGVGVGLLSASPPEGIKLLVDFVEEPTKERLITWMRSMVYAEQTLTPELIELRWQQCSSPTTIETAQRMYSRRAISAVSMAALLTRLDHLPAIEAPTLLLWGRDDRVTPLDMALAPMRLIPKCELHVFYDCGHWAMIERKDEFESVTMSFLGRAGSATTSVQSGSSS